MGIIVTSHGIIIVDRNRENSSALPGKRKNAKAYAARLAVISWPSMMAVATTKLLPMNRATGMVSNT